MTRIAPKKGVDYDIVEGPSGCNTEASLRGKAQISQGLLEKIAHQTGFLPYSAASGTAEIQTTFIKRTTDSHCDCNTETSKPVLPGGKVAFIPANTHKEAHFQHGDEKVPIVEGQLLEFDGGVEHNTVVNSGVVMLLGPFELPLLESVMPTPAPMPDCETLDAEDCCIENSDCLLCPTPSPTRFLESKGSKGGGDSSGDECSFECVSVDNSFPGCAQCID